MIKVSLLGDSIRQIGYGTKVPELLGKDFEVFQPADNCRFAKYTLRGLFDWREGMEGSRIVHWNNGLWDVSDLFGDGPFSSPEEYKATMLRIADILQKRHEIVIFATTTPVRSDNAFNKNNRIAAYNDMLVPLFKERGILINDLGGTVSRDVESYIRADDRIHLTDIAIDLCARQVADCILNAAKLLK